MQEHERAAAFAVGCCASQGGLEQICQLQRIVSFGSCMGD